MTNVEHTEPRDPYVGEIYMDEDSRSDNRRIRIVEKLGDDWRASMSKMFKHEPGIRYRYVTITNDSNPSTIGRTGKIRAKTLDERYRKVSR